MYIKLKKFKNTINSLNKAIEINPVNSQDYTLRANCQTILNNFNAAIKDYNKVTELNPSDTNTYYSRELALYNLSGL